MSADLTLFDLDRSMLRVAEPEPLAVDAEGLARMAFLYTCTETGTATGVRFMATVPDAMRWCSSDLSRGVLHGTEWAYCWTSVWNFVQHREGWVPEYGGRPSLTIKLDPAADSGDWDERIASTGCQMIRLREIPGVLAPLGVEVTLT